MSKPDTFSVDSYAYNYSKAPDATLVSLLAQPFIPKKVPFWNTTSRMMISMQKLILTMELTGCSDKIGTDYFYLVNIYKYNWSENIPQP